MTTTEHLRADAPGAIARAAELLRDGHVVAFPTETVYGLGACGLRDASVAAIFRAKGRPSDNPLILHVPDIARALPLWDAPPDALDRARLLADRFWPGPLTLVLPASSAVPLRTRAGLPKVAVRAPAHPVAQALLRAVQTPLAAPSANASGRPSPTRAEDVLATLSGRIAAVLDGGPTQVGVESTVLDLTEAEAVILRPGMIPVDALSDALSGHLRAQPARLHDDASVASPGLRHRHYAPDVAHIALIAPDDLRAHLHPDDALLVTARHAAQLGLGADHRGHTERLPDDPTGYARHLFAALYRAERAAPRRLWLVHPCPELGPLPPADSPWRAVLDRLARAAEPKT